MKRRSQVPLYPDFYKTEGEMGVSTSSSPCPKTSLAPSFSTETAFLTSRSKCACRRTPTCKMRLPSSIGSMRSASCSPGPSPSTTGLSGEVCLVFYFISRDRLLIHISRPYRAHGSKAKPLAARSFGDAPGAQYSPPMCPHNFPMSLYTNSWYQGKKLLFFRFSAHGHPCPFVG